MPATSPCHPPDAPSLRSLVHLYRLLGRLWLSEIDRPLLDLLLTPSLGNHYTAVGGVLPEGPAEHNLERLRTDYCALLLGPRGHLPPYQSVWTSGHFQDSTAGSTRRYLQLVRQPDSWINQEMPDHLGTQLCIMAALLLGLAEHSYQADPAHADLLALVKQFSAHHLSWPDRFLNCAQAICTSSFYRGLICVTRNHLEIEASFWRDQ